MADFVHDLSRFLEQQQVPDLWAWLLLAPGAPEALVEERLAERRRWAEAHVADPIYGMEAVFVLVHEEGIRGELARTATLVARRRARGRNAPPPVDTVTEKARSMHRDAELPPAPATPLSAEDEVTAATDLTLSAPTAAQRRRAGRELFKRAALSLRTFRPEPERSAAHGPMGDAEATEDQDGSGGAPMTEETVIQVRPELPPAAPLQLRGLASERSDPGFGPDPTSTPPRGVKVMTFSRKKTGGLVPPSGEHARPGSLWDPERQDQTSPRGIPVTHTLREEIPEAAAGVATPAPLSEAPTTIRPRPSPDAVPNLALAPSPTSRSGLSVLRRSGAPARTEPGEPGVRPAAFPTLGVRVRSLEPPPPEDHEPAVRGSPAVPLPRLDSPTLRPDPVREPDPVPEPSVAAPPSPPARSAPAVGVASRPVAAWLLVVIGMLSFATGAGLVYLTFHVKPPGFGGVPMDPDATERAG